MDHALISRFAPLIRAWTPAELEAEIADPRHLLLVSGAAGGRRIDVAYAPFEHLNADARIVIVGLTPGRQQMGNALRELRRALVAGASPDDALAAAKIHASFSGPMRTNLVDLLDAIGVARLLGISSTATLWTTDTRLVHFTSALRNPVFIDGANYSGSPSMLTTPMLLDQLRSGFAKEVAALPNALFVPLGPKVSEAVELLVREGMVKDERLLSGLPHPSGANAERIAFFLGRKSRETLSNKVVPDLLDAARHGLRSKVDALTG